MAAVELTKITLWFERYMHAQVACYLYSDKAMFMTAYWQCFLFDRWNVRGSKIMPMG